MLEFCFSCWTTTFRRKGSVCQKVSISVGQYQFLSRTTHRVFLKLERIFLKFYIKVESLRVEKLTEPNFSEKFSFSEKATKFLQNRVFWLLSRNLCFDVSFLNLKMVHNSVIYDSAKFASGSSAAV